MLSADEKISIQARGRCHPTLPPGPGTPMRVEHAYVWGGAWAYHAAWDDHRAKVFSRCEATTGIPRLDRLVAQVTTQEPYRSAHRVFWVVENGSSHRSQCAIAFLQALWPTLVLVQTPIHANWLIQIKIAFSIVQRKVLAPNDFRSLAAVEDRLLRFQTHYEAIAQPLAWRFTREDLNAPLDRLVQTDRGFPGQRDWRTHHRHCGPEHLDEKPPERPLSACRFWFPESRQGITSQSPGRICPPGTS